MKVLTVLTDQHNEVNDTGRREKGEDETMKSALDTLERGVEYLKALIKTRAQHLCGALFTGRKIFHTFL